MSASQFKLTDEDAFSDGTLLFIGCASSYQGPIASNICFNHLLDNRVLVQLVDSGGGHQPARESLINWTRAERHPPERLRFRTVCAYPYGDSAEVLRAIGNALSESDQRLPLLIFRDLAQSVLPLHASDIWFAVAAEIASALDTPVVTSATYGHHIAQRPNLTGYSARVLEVTASNGVNATITDIRTSRKWKAKGRPAPGVLLFDVSPEIAKEIAR